VVVDDGSMDGSRPLLQERYGANPHVRLVLKDNGGQLSAFHAGLAASRADVVFFLDSDDRYAPTRLEETLAAWAVHPDCAAVFCPVLYFGALQGFDHVEGRPARRPMGRSAEQITAEFERLDGDKCFGPGRDDFLVTRRWLGAPTSGLAAKRPVLDSFLPLSELEPVWKLRADDCIVHGVALTNQPRLYLHRPVVQYRVHGKNGFHGRKQDRRATCRHQQAVAELIDSVCRRLSFDLTSEFPRLLESYALAVWHKHQPRRWSALRKAWRLLRRSRAPWPMQVRCRIALLRVACGLGTRPWTGAQVGPRRSEIQQSQRIWPQTSATDNARRHV
jgi:glycosyltransferase involved in cell wall biosynthesis